MGHLLACIWSEHLILGGWHGSWGPFIILTLHHFRRRDTTALRRSLNLIFEFNLHFFRPAVVIDQVLNVLILANHATALTRLVVSLTLLLLLLAALTEQNPDDFEILLSWLAFTEHVPIVACHWGKVDSTWMILLDLRSDRIIFEIFRDQRWPEIFADFWAFLIDLEEQLKLLALFDRWDQSKVL